MKDEELQNQSQSKIVGKIVQDKNGIRLIMDDPCLLTQEQKKINGKQVLNEGGKYE